MEIRTPEELEGHLAAFAAEMTAPREDECVLCFVDRMLGAFGCDTTLRWARRWRALRAPRATGLVRRLEDRGGFCDCEVLLNGWTLREDLQVDDEDGERAWPEVRPACAGAGRRSSQPCSNWVPRRRPQW